MLWYVVLYVIGILAGLGASLVLDVQLRRPGVRQVLGLVIFGFLVWGALAVTQAPFADVLLPIVWAGTGLLAGLGSRDPHAHPAPESSNQVSH